MRLEGRSASDPTRRISRAVRATTLMMVSMSPPVSGSSVAVPLGGVAEAAHHDVGEGAHEAMRLGPAGGVEGGAESGPLGQEAAAGGAEESDSPFLDRLPDSVGIDDARVVGEEVGKGFRGAEAHGGGLGSVRTRTSWLWRWKAACRTRPLACV
jgi:hypothetical protein